MNKRQRHYYKKKCDKIKKYINRDFSRYSKVFSFNEISGFYQVEFIIDGRIINFDILPDCLYSEFKQKILSCLNDPEYYSVIKETNLNRREGKKCEYCIEKSFIFCQCENCLFLICMDCSDKIYFKNCCIYICPKCNKITPPPPDTSVIERMIIVHKRRLEYGLEPLIYISFDPSPLIANIDNKFF